jgi:hypothetical protein
MRYARPVEALEPRKLLAAPTVEWVSASHNDTGVFVVVDYTADAGLDMSTIGAGDFIATRGDDPPLVANLFSPPTEQANGKIRTIYLFQAPEGAWNYTDTGHYAVTSPAGQVKDLNSESLNAGLIRDLSLWFSQPRATVPTSTVRTHDWLIVVNYTDNGEINTATLGNNDIRVEGPVVLTGITLYQTIINAPNNVTAVYRVPAPPGGWAHIHTGRYYVYLNHREVRDTTGIGAGEHMMRSFGLGWDNPSARVQSTTVLNDQWLIPIKFAGRTPIDPSSITGATTTVTAPNGYSENGALHQLIDTGGGTYVAVFSFLARGGLWDYSDNASYTLSINANTVRDSSGRYVNGGPYKTYGLWFNNPAATVTNAFAVPDRFDLVIRFHDNVAIDPSTITVNAISITGPVAMTTTLVSIVNDPISGKRAVFRITPTSGTFVNGHYTVTINPNQVRDTEGFAVRSGMLARYSFWFPPG